MTPDTISVKVDGTDRSSLVEEGGFSLQLRSNDQRSTGSITFKSGDGSWRPLAGQTFETFEGSPRMLYGNIAEIEELRVQKGPASGNPGLYYKCAVVNRAARLDRRFITAVYQNMTAQDIALDILNGDHNAWIAAEAQSGTPLTYPSIASAEGLTATSATIDVGPTIDLLKFNHVSASKALDTVATTAGKVWYVRDSDGAVVMQDRTAFTAPFALSDTSGNFTSLSVKRSNPTDYSNITFTQVADDGTQSASIAFTGDGTARTWTLDTGGDVNQAAFGIDRLGSAVLNLDGTETFIQIGEAGSDSPYEWDGNLTITQKSSEAVLTIHDTLAVTFFPSIFRWIYTENATEVSARAAIEGTSGRYESVQRDDAHATRGLPAINAATDALVPMSHISTVAVIGTEGPVAKPRPGMVVAVGTTSPAASGSFLIQDVTATFKAGIGFRYSATAIDSNRIPNWIDYFKALAGIKASAAAGNSGSGTGTGATSPPAPNATGFTPVINYTEIGGAKYWNLTGSSITVDDANPDYAQTRRLYVSIPGVDIITCFPFGPIDHKVSFQTPDYPRDVADHDFTPTVIAENATGALTPDPFVGDPFTITGASSAIAPSGPAPNVTWASTPTVSWAPYGVDWIPTISGTLNLPTTDPDYAHLKTIVVGRKGPDATSPPYKLYPPVILSAPFSGATVPVIFDLGPISDYASHGWVLTAYSSNEDGEQTTPVTGNSTSVTVDPPHVSSFSAVDTSAHVADSLRGVTTTVDVTANIANSQATPQAVTVWIEEAPIPRMGVYWVSGASQTIHIPLVWIPETNTTYHVKVVSGNVEVEPASPASVAFTLNGFATPPAAGTGTQWVTGANFTGLSGHLKYFSSGAGFVFKPGTITCSAKFLEIADLKSVEFFVQNGKWNGSTWTADPSDNGDHPFCGAYPGMVSTDDNNFVSVVGDAVSITPRVFWSVRPSTHAYPDCRIHICATTAVSGITRVSQSAFAGQTSPTSDIVFSSDGQYAYLLPSFTAALAAGAQPWDAGLFGDRLTLDSNKKLAVTAMPAPGAPLAVTANIQSTSAGTLGSLGGLDAWRAVGEITPPSDASHVQEYLIKIPGYADYSKSRPASGWVLNGNGRVDYSTPSEYQNTAQIGPLTLSCVARNEDAQESAAVTASITIPALVHNVGGSAATPVAITSASVVVHYQQFGHEWRPYFTATFIAPSDGGANKFVRISQISPSGIRSQVAPDYFVAGGFTPGSQYSITGDTADWETGTWNIGFLAVNADNIPATELQISATVAANVITSTAGAENTGARFTQPGGAAFGVINVTATITSASAPGLGGSGQDRTDYISRDNGATWKWLGWFSQKQGTESSAWQIDRPTAGDLTCKVASAIGAFNAIPDGLSSVALPSNVVVSPSFTFARVGAPSFGCIQGAQVNARTASGSAAYHGVTIAVSGGAVTWGLPDGIQWINPPRSGSGSDPNFFYAALTAQCYNGNGVTPAPPSPASGNTTSNQGGLETIVHKWSDPGLINFTDIEGWEFNPSGSTNTTMRFRIYAVSRSANDWTDTTYRTLQATLDVDFGPVPTATTISDFLDLDRVHVHTAFTADCGLATELGYLARSIGPTPSLNPGGTYGALTHKAGSQWWYWGGSAWASVDLATVGSGGVASINSQTGPVTLIGSNITVSPGVPVAGQVTLSIPQDVATTASVTFAGVTVNTNFHAVCGIATDLGLVAKSTTTAPALTPPSQYSGLTHKSGSVWWHYNPLTSTWGTVDLSVSGGITSVTGSGAGISVSTNTGAVTISNTGVTSVQTITGAVNLAAGAGISITANNPVAGSVLIALSGQAGNYVKSLNSLTDVITLTGASNGVVVSTGSGNVSLSLSSSLVLSGVTVSTNFNAQCGIATDLGFMARFSAGTPSWSPGGLYGALQPQSGSSWWLWNGSSWNSVTLGGSSGAVSSVNGLTGAVNFAQGTGVTITNNLPSSGFILFSIGQSVATSAFVQFGGVTVSGNAAWNSLSSSGGIKVSGAVQAGEIFTADQSSYGNNFVVHAAKPGVASLCVDGYDQNGSTTAVPSIVGRHIRLISGVYQSVDNVAAFDQNAILFSFGGRGSYNDGNGITGISGANSADIVFAASETWRSFSQGSEIRFRVTSNGTTQRNAHMYLRHSGQLEIMTGFNAHCGLATDLGVLYKSTFGATPAFTPGGSYGALAHSSGSTWWTWNGAAWSSITLGGGGGGGITSIQGQSAGGLILVNGQYGPISSGAVTLTLNTGGDVTFGNVTAQSSISAGAVGVAIRTQSNTFTVTNTGAISCDAITIQTSFNAICGIATSLGYLAATRPSGPSFSPPSSYGALAHRSGTTWWYWTGAQWRWVDLANVSGGG